MAISLFTVINYFSGVSYTPKYDEQVSTRDCRLQLVFTIVTLPVVIYFVATNLIETIGVPIVTPMQSSPFPAPSDVASLFAQQADTASDTKVQAVVCPCSQQVSKLSEVAEWVAPEDSFCSSLRSSYNLFFDDKLNDLKLLLKDKTNENCITNYSAFLANVRQIAKNAELFASDENFETNTDKFAQALQDSLCSLAFGLAQPSAFSPNGYAFGGIPSRSTTFLNDCFPGAVTDDDSFAEIQYLVPSAFDYSVSEANIVQIQASRMLNYLQSAIETCNSLYVLREGFLRSVRNEFLVTPNALAPEELGREVERIWRLALTRASLPSATLVPGFSPSDKLAAFTDVANPIELLAESDEAFQTVPPSNIPVDAFPFSSRLPFVRADFIKGGLKFFYVLARIPSAKGPVVPILAGQARVSVNTTSIHVPLLQVLEDFGHVTPGWTIENSTFAPLGDDLLSLLDACATGASIFVDVHNLRPVVIEDADLANRSSYSPMFRSLNFDNTCNVGLPPPSTSSSIPQDVLFSVPLTCPPLLVRLGQLRANSSYINFTSFARPFVDGNIESIVELFFNAFQGDLGERSALFTNLMITKGAIAFNSSAEQHYTLCAPAVCSYTLIEPPTTPKIINNALANYGGTASSIIMLLGSAVLYLSFISYQLKRRKEKRLARIARSTADERITANPLSVRSERAQFLGF